jgi:ABC-type glycerol-3-phosphate transport system substrate-binding protein
MVLSSKQARIALAAAAVVLGLAGCGETTSSKSFTGEEHAVAQRVSDFQKHATESSQSKLCNDDLASTLVTSIRASGKGCTEALKEQLKSVEDLTVTIESVSVDGKTATAIVKSTRSGKSVPDTLKLVKEGGAWKISGLV